MSVEKQWHFKTLSEFKNYYFKGLITKSMQSGEQIYIKSFINENGFEEADVNFFLHPFKKDNLIYLLPSQHVLNLPVLIKSEKQIAYSGKGYRIPTYKELPKGIKFDVKNMRIEPKHVMSAPDLLKRLFPIDKTNNLHGDLYKIIGLAAYLDRINVRIATEPSFGKTSLFSVMKSLLNDVAIITNPTLAKLKYLTDSKVLVIDEVSSAKAESKKDMEPFSLACAAFDISYENPSKGIKGVAENMNIENMSLVFIYNTLNNYSTSNKYFDFTWENNGAMNNRIFPLVFDGFPKNKFNQVTNHKQEAINNIDEYMAIIKEIKYLASEYQDNPYKTKMKFSFGKAFDRWETNFNIMVKWIGVFSETEEIYKERVKELYKAHIQYLKMVGHKEISKSDNSDQPLTLIEEAVSNSGAAKILEYLEKYDKGEGLDIDTVINACLVDEELIQKMKSKADLYEPHTGKISLLK